MSISFIGEVSAQYRCCPIFVSRILIWIVGRCRKVRCGREERQDSDYLDGVGRLVAQQRRHWLR
jgi:hypothetical protein